MKRFLFGTIAALLCLGFAFFIEGGRIGALFLPSPFIIAFGVPLFATLAVWNFKAWARAWGDAMAPARESGSREASARLWGFYEKACYAAGIVAFFLGSIIILSSPGQEAAGLKASFAVDLIAPLYALLLALIARILRHRVDAGE